MRYSGCFGSEAKENVQPGSKLAEKGPAVFRRGRCLISLTFLLSLVGTIEEETWVG